MVFKSLHQRDTYILFNKRSRSLSDLLTASILKYPLIIRSFHRTFDLAARNGRVDERRDAKVSYRDTARHVWATISVIPSDKRWNYICLANVLRSWIHKRLCGKLTKSIPWRRSLNHRDCFWSAWRDRFSLHYYALHSEPEKSTHVPPPPRQKNRPTF